MRHGSPPGRSQWTALQAHAPPGSGAFCQAAAPVRRRVALCAYTMPFRSRGSAMVGRDGAPLRSLLTIAAAHGGQKGSSLPARFELLLNRRFQPEERFEAALGEIETVVHANSFGATTT